MDISPIKATIRRAASRERRSNRLGGDTRRFGLALVAVALVFFFEWTSGGFLTIDNFKSILLNSSPVLIVAITSGALVISGNVDLSIGGMYAFTSVVTAVLARNTQDPTLAIVAGLAVGTGLGLANGVLVRLLSISPLIVTLGLMSVYRGGAYVVTDGGTIFGLPESFTNIGRAYPLGVAFPVWVALVFFVIAGFALMRTVGGMRTFAIGGHREAAVFNGVKVDRHVTALYALNGLAIGIVSVLTTSQIGSGSGSTGVNFEFDVLTAVILGGVAFAGGAGLPVGIFIGVVTIAILNAGMIFAGIQDFYQQIAKGAVLLLALGADQVTVRRRVRVSDEPAGTKPVGAAETPIEADRAEGRPVGSSFDAGDVVFSCAGLSKRYGAVRAVGDVGFDVRAGEIVCLLGDNGAGKSSVIKMITGVVPADTGTVTLRGEPIQISSPTDARRAGIETVYQDLALCPNLGAALNLVLGDEPRKGIALGPLSLIDFERAEDEARLRLGRLGVRLEDYYRPVGSLSGGQRQSAAIARVADGDVSLAILDEPTAALGVTQSRRTVELIRSLAAHGVGVILITHDVETVLAVADRIVVLHLGDVLYDGDIGSVDQSDLIHLMAGLRPERLATGIARPKAHARSAERV
jgi:ribose/xylose/arabinose/galactoside ABC-type transport system permease subunit/ABC-type branched-subunit amino acid transport system ATPase component